MGNWKYYQIIATFYRAIFNLIGQGVVLNEAIDRTFNDFWFLPEEKNILPNLICLVQYVDVKFSLERSINNELVFLFNSQIEKMKLINLEESLSSDEIEHMTETIDEIKFKIKNMNIT